MDTSALFKRYIPELGSVWVQNLADPQTGNTLVIARLTTAEFIAALIRRQRDKQINITQFNALRRAFLSEVENRYIVINLNKDVIAGAHDLLISYPLRTLDAIQLAAGLKAAQAFPGLVIISADTRLLAAAAAEGLPTDDPNLHP